MLILTICFSFAFYALNLCSVVADGRCVLKTRDIIKRLNAISNRFKSMQTFQTKERYVSIVFTYSCDNNNCDESVRF